MAKPCSVNRCSVMHSTMLLFGLLVMAILKPTVAEVGVCYGMMADNLPPRAEVISLFQQRNIPSTRLYAPDEAAFQALGGTGIKLLLDVPNDHDLFQGLATSQANADQWVQDNVVKYSNVNFQYIAVGNEVKPTDSFAQFLLPAMENIRKAIVAVGLGDQIKVSTATFFGAIDDASFPPSNGNFRPEYQQQLLGPVINFLKDNPAPILVNIYPYFSLSGQVSLEYALFTSPSTVVTDGPLQYQNLFDAMVDTFYSALEKAGGEPLKIVVSESGWPSDGADPAITNVDNAKTYNTKLVQHVNQGQGTPKKPGPIEAYIFAMFDEKDKPGDETERHFGLFFPNKQEKYPISFN